MQTQNTTSRGGYRLWAASDRNEDDRVLRSLRYRRMQLVKDAKACRFAAGLSGQPAKQAAQYVERAVEIEGWIESVDAQIARQSEKCAVTV